MTSVASMRHLMAVKRRGTVRDAGGGFQDTWNVEETAWCAIRPIRSNKTPSGRDNIYEVTTRSEHNVRAGDRLTRMDNAQDYDVRTVLPADPKGHHIKITVVEITKM